MNKGFLHQEVFNNWLLSMKEAGTLTQVRWFFGTQVHHHVHVLALQKKSVSLPPAPHLLIYWPVV